MIKPENRNCYEFFRDCTKDFGVYDVAESFGNLVSRKKFFNDVESIAGYLDSKNIKRGDVVTLFLPNTVQSFAAFYAANRIGAIANIVHPLTPPDVLEDILKSTHSKAVFILDILMEKYVSMLRRRNRLVVVCSPSDYAAPLMRPAFKVFEKVKVKTKTPSSTTASYHTICNLNLRAPKLENNGDDIAVFLHGGGTTGKSKTIQLTSKNLNELAYKLSFFDSPHAPGAECSLAVLPLFHAFGLGVVMHFSMCAGFTCIPMTNFSAEKANRLIKKYNITYIVGVPAMFKKMYEASNFDGPHLSKLRLLWAGGDFISDTFLNSFNSLLEKWHAKGKLYRGYGLTEVSSVCTANIKGAYRDNSIGRPLDGITVEIWGEKRKKLPPNTIGEIVISGSTVMAGYYDSEDDGVYVDKKGRRWVCSGDLGYMDEDGFVFFTGRKKRMIIISGYNVYPNDIENEVLKLDYINEACAVQGYVDSKPVIKLFVSLNQPTDNPDEVRKCIKEYCDSKLERFSRPSSVTILDALPRTRMSKIDFMKLTDTPPAPAPTKKEVREERKAKREIEKAAEKAGREAERIEKEEREAAEKARESQKKSEDK
ncbi:MAG: acyl--CoA ligase [Clostridia bacterium]|nr:acyl--CoA ligase [Clostridia bacterium]